MNIVILDGYATNPGDLSWGRLEKLGELTVYDRTPNADTEEIIRRINEAEIVITNKTPLTRDVFSRCSALRYVGVLATGYNVVDVQAAKEHGVVVTNIPTYGTMAVAQFAIAMLLEICHRIGHHAEAVRNGAWAENPDWSFWDYPLIELNGKTMGIIGYGRIGKATAKIAEALGMSVIAYGDASRGAPYVSPDEFFARADVISLHAPLTAENEKMINRETIAKMKDGVILLNNARGQLINEQDLADALNAGKVYAAGLDVVSVEPISDANPLRTAKNCFITPHISWAPIEARERIIIATEENLQAFLAGEPVNVVNR